MHPSLRLGVRSSAMAVGCAEHAKRLIQQISSAITVDIMPYASEGDMIQGDLKLAGGKGLFIKDLERRLLAGEIDCALHTLKDVPGDVPMHPDLMLFAFLAREDPRDALVLRRDFLEENLSRGSIGTSAPRRKAVLSQMYPGADVILARGNVDTRIRHLDEGRYDAIVVSAAGLKRLGIENRISRHYDTSEMLPAVGQGIICLQVRRFDAERCNFLRQINDRWSETAADAERSVLKALNGNCHSAIAAHCFRRDNKAVLEAIVFNVDGSRMIRVKKETHIEGFEIGTMLGHSVASDLVNRGACALI